MFPGHVSALPDASGAWYFVSCSCVVIRNERAVEMEGMEHCLCRMWRTAVTVVVFHSFMFHTLFPVLCIENCFFYGSFRQRHRGRYLIISDRASCTLRVDRASRTHMLGCRSTLRALHSIWTTLPCRCCCCSLDSCIYQHLPASHCY